MGLSSVKEIITFQALNVGIGERVQQAQEVGTSLEVDGVQEHGREDRSIHNENIMLERPKD